MCSEPDKTFDPVILGDLGHAMIWNS